MHALLLAALMSLPIYPLNPAGQDTISFINMHVAVGLNGPNSYVSAGPEFSARYEMVLHHPFVFRATGDYRYGRVTSILYPNGDIHRGTIGL